MKKVHVQMFGIAINYFSKNDYPGYVRESVRFSMSLLRSCSEVSRIILVDSGESSDEEIEKFCLANNISYVHTGEKLSFAKAYNKGVSMLDEEWVVTMASDVYIKKNTFLEFKNFIEKYTHLPIGCLIPYLSHTGLPGQQKNARAGRSCYFPLMTFNLNVFRREVFEDIKGIRDEYSGNYNDVDVCIRLHENGKKIFLVSSFAHHYGGLTTDLGSDVDYKTDKIRFFSNYKQYERPGSLWDVDLTPFLQSSVAKVMYRSVCAVPTLNRRRQAVRQFIKFLPHLQRV